MSLETIRTCLVKLAFEKVHQTTVPEVLVV
jgi:hypothetical protein